MKTFDTHNELSVQRYRNGIKLVKPSCSDNYLKNTISSIFSLPLSAYFVSANNQLVNGNDISVEIVGAQSRRDFIGNTLDTFVSKEFLTQVDRNNAAVIRNERLCVTEESGVRKDDVAITALTFKFPWYYEDKVVGLFGCSISTPLTAMGDFSQLILQLISTGLLSYDALPAVSPNNACHYDFLSNRENEVLAQLLRGKTAKETGRILDISFKTVEHHLENIRFKTNCKTRSELFDKFANKE